MNGEMDKGSGRAVQAEQHILKRWKKEKGKEEEERGSQRKREGQKMETNERSRKFDAWRAE